MSSEADEIFDSMPDDDADGASENAIVLTRSLSIKARSFSSEEDAFAVENEFRGAERQLFVLTDAGKPVYSRHGSEERLVTLMGVIQALVSVTECMDDRLNYIVTGHCKIAFFCRSHLIICCVSDHALQSARQIATELDYFYYQILSLMSLYRIENSLGKSSNFDLRQWLNEHDVCLFHRLVDHFAVDPSIFLTCYRCLPLPEPQRELIRSILLSSCKQIDQMVFALILARDQVVTAVSFLSHTPTLHHIDIYLLLNLIRGSDNFKNNESYVPVCLPKFDSRGYLYMYVQYIEQKYEVCLLLLKATSNDFHLMSESRLKIAQALSRDNLLQAIVACAAAERPLVSLSSRGRTSRASAQSVGNDTGRGSDGSSAYTPSPKPPLTGSCSFTLSSISAPQAVLHFLYVSRPLKQFIMPCAEAPYNSDDGWRRLCDAYRVVQQHMLNACVSTVACETIDRRRPASAAAATSSPAATAGASATTAAAAAATQPGTPLQYSPELLHALPPAISMADSKFGNVYYATDFATVIGYMRADFEIYAAFSPLITKVAANLAINDLLTLISNRWAFYFSKFGNA